MPDKPVNKVVYGEEVLIDLTDTTATADKILVGYGAYGKDGAWMNGAAPEPNPDGKVYQDENGYVVLDDDQGTYVDIDALNVTENGTYTASTGHAYSPVSVNVTAPVQSVNGQTGVVVLDAEDVSALPDDTTIPSKTSDLTNDSGFITTETDPTVPSWAKASTKPSYTAAEVGALPDTTTIPSKTSDLTNDSGFIVTETDPTVPSWAKASTKPSYTASEVGAVATSAVGAANGVVPLNASSKIDESYLPSYVDDVIEGYFYNGNFYKESSHTTVITGEAGKIYVDLTTDKTYRYGGSTFVEISSGTTVSVSRDLTTGTKVATITVNGTGSDIYAPTPPTKVSDLTNDSGFITGISSSDVTTALGYTPYNSTNPNGYVNATGAANAAPVQSVNGSTGTVVLTAADVGALPDTTTIPSKTSDLTNDSGFITGMTILSYGSSTWQDFLDAYNANKVVYCRASSNSNPASGSQTRLAFMAYVSNATNPTNVEFQYYRSMSSHSETQQGDEVYVYKLANTGTWTVTVRKTSPNIVAGTGLSRSYSNDTVTLSFNGTIPTKTSDLTNDSGYLTLSTLPIWDGSVT